MAFFNLEGEKVKKIYIYVLSYIVKKRTGKKSRQWKIDCCLDYIIPSYYINNSYIYIYKLPLNNNNNNNNFNNKQSLLFITIIVVMIIIIEFKRQTPKWRSVVGLWLLGQVD